MHAGQNILLLDEAVLESDAAEVSLSPLPGVQLDIVWSNSDPATRDKIRRLGRCDGAIEYCRRYSRTWPCLFPGATGTRRIPEGS